MRSSSNLKQGGGDGKQNGKVAPLNWLYCKNNFWFVIKRYKKANMKTHIDFLLLNRLKITSS